MQSVGYDNGERPQSVLPSSPVGVLKVYFLSENLKRFLRGQALVKGLNTTSS